MDILSPGPAPQSPSMDDDDERIEQLHQRAAALDELMAAGCRHCGEPVEAGTGGVICTVPLEVGERPHGYAAHVACQQAVLDELAAMSHEAISRWKLTAAGATVLAQDRNERGAR